MRKNVISRRSLITVATVKMVNLTDFSMIDKEYMLDGYMEDDTILSLDLETGFKPLAVLGKAYKAVTYYMEPQDWVKYAKVGDVEVLTDDQAAVFGKRNRNKGE